MGNRSNRYAPQGVYPTVGDDCWLAVCVRDEDDFAALCGVIGRDDLAKDASLQTAEGRRARHDELDEAIAKWAAPQDHITAANILQGAGVPAAPVMQNWEVAHDNHLHDRGFFQRIRHPVAGTYDFPGFPWIFGTTKLAIRYHAPAFAENNADVFHEVLDLDDDQIASLYREAVTSDEPIFAVGPSL